MSTILKHIGLQRKGDEGDHKVSEGLEDEHIEVKKKGDEDVLEKKVDIGLEEPIDVVDDEDVIEIEPFLTQRPHVRPARRKRASVYLSTPFTTLPKRSRHQPPRPPSQAIVYDPMHKILDVHLDRLRAWITHACTMSRVKPFMGKNRRLFSRLVYVSHLDALFLFIRLKIKAMIPSSRTSQSDTIFMRILVSKWPLYKECIKENRPLDRDEEYRLVDYVVGQKWTSKILGQVWDSLPSLTTAEEMTNILLPIRQLVPKLLDSTGFFDRRGRSSTYKEPWPVVIVDPIPLQRNNCDCGVFAIKYFEYIVWCWFRYIMSRKHVIL
ncbi:hypothetical protein IC575_026996 [Cucumis melo]